MDVYREIRRVRILEEAAPEEIEREVAAGEEEEGELGGAGEARSRGAAAEDVEMRRRRRGGGIIVRRGVEAEEGEEAEGEGEEDDQLPAEPQHVPDRHDLRGLLHRRRRRRRPPSFDCREAEEEGDHLERDDGGFDACRPREREGKREKA